MAARETGEKMVRSYCGLCGPITGCGINCYVKNGRMVRIEAIYNTTFEKNGSGI
jgi:hypothetical protein